MRIGLRFLAVLVPLLALSIFGATKIFERLEKRWLIGDLNRRAKLVTESTHDYLLESLSARRISTIERLLQRVARDERLYGALLCSTSNEVLAKSGSLHSDVNCSGAAERAREAARIRKLDNLSVHEAMMPLGDSSTDAPRAFLLLLHDTSYMSNRHVTTRWYVGLLLAGLSLVLFTVMLAVYRWTMTDSLRKLRVSLRGLITGNAFALEESLKTSEFSPLAKDLSKVLRELRQAKAVIKEAESGTQWTPSRLRAEVQKLFGDSQLCVIANREPYIHNKKGNKVEVQMPASGLVTAVEPIVRACSGLWIAHGSGSADRQTADATGKLLVPPNKPEYVLKRVWLTKAEEEGYYYGFSNEGLWPLCHIAHARPLFDSDDWRQYEAVNKKFADAFAAENASERPVVLIQDYHFALLPQLIRARRPDAVLTLFWHIPWPNPEAFGICPWKKEVLIGMLGSDLIGFHTQYHCNNFLDTVDRFLEARVDRENFSVTIQGHTCFVKPFSISVEWPSSYELPLEEFEKERLETLADLNLPRDIKIGIGVDRVDYTKGIVERFLSIEKMLDQHPELVGKFVFVQIGAPSRTHIKRYQDLNAEVQELADRINWKFNQAEVPPILLKLVHHNPPELFRYYRAADICFVSSLHDGMNLVAKEYISAHKDGDGVLILSTFAGASRELTDALLVNPYDLDECAHALYTSLTMPESERRARMQRLRQVVAERNVYFWAGALLAETQRIANVKQAPA